LYEQEIADALGNVATKVGSGQVPSEDDIIMLAQLVDIRTTLLYQLRDQVMASESIIQELISDLETADLTMEDMDDFIGKLRNALEAAR
jgi:hypothetical protein